MSEVAWAVKFRVPGSEIWLWNYDSKNDRYGNDWAGRRLSADRDRMLVELRWARQDAYEAKLVRVTRRTRKEINAMLADFWDRSRSERTNALAEAEKVARTFTAYSSAISGPTRDGIADAIAALKVKT